MAMLATATAAPPHSPSAPQPTFHLEAHTPLTAAVQWVRETIANQAALPAAERASQIVVQLPPGRLTLPAGGLVLTAADAGLAATPSTAGTQVLWRGAADGSTVLDGGVPVTGWQRDPSAGAELWSAPVPPGLADAADPTGYVVVRQLWADGVRLNRTRTSSADAGLTALAGTTITDSGYLTPSAVPLSWADPAAAEIVSDHTWMQHRCALDSVVTPSAPSAPSQAAFASVSASGSAPSCNWTSQVPGSSPGESLKQLNVSSYEACQAACCATGAACLAIIYHPRSAPDGNCYLLPRRFQPNYEPSSDGFVANMNAPPPPPPRAMLTVQQPCFTIARTQPTGSYTLQYPTFIENTGNFSRPGQWFFDRARARFLAWPPAGIDLSTASVVAGQNQTLLRLENTHDVAWTGVSFAHATWLQPMAPEGFVERYGGVYYSPAPNASAKADSGLVMMPSAAAVVAVGVHRVTFDNCSFAHLGLWGLRLRGGAQDVSVTRCSFVDMGGGGIYLGDVNDTAQTDPTLQMANLSVTDCVLQGLGRDFPGAPGLHSFCTRNMTLAHNRVADVGYTGISLNWPAPQGPTLGPDRGGSAVGYSTDNAVLNNDISRFMGYMRDGGGLHTIGRTDTSRIAGNYFHDLAAGQPGAVSVVAQSIIYIDNWSCGLTIENNVVQRCAATQQGAYFFQGSKLGPAHDNTISHLFLQDAGTISGGGSPCNCSDVVTVPAGAPLPAAAAAIVAAAGPRASNGIVV